MTKSGGRSAGHKHGRKATHPVGKRTTSDRGIYLGFIIIGGAVVLLAVLLSAGEGSLTGWATLGYVALLAWLTITSAFAAYRGRDLPPWRRSLARLPLRCVGYGTKGGKPISAAHDAPAARKVIIASVVFSVIVLLVLAYFLVPEIRAAIGG